MTNLSNTRAVSLAAVFAFSAVGAARGQFYATGFAEGTTTSKVTGLSADGRSAAGFSDSTHGYMPGFIWSVGAGRNDFGSTVGMPIQTISNGISGDGTTAVGATRSVMDGTLRPFIYRAGGSFQTLGTVGAYAQSEAKGVSGDGAVVVGDARDTNFVGSVAFRWTESGGMQSLGYTRPTHFSSYATGISRNGRSTVGYSYGNGSEDAFIWTADQGMQGLRGINGQNARAFGTNGDGSIVVGDSIFTSTRTHAVIWQDGSVLDLGVTSAMRRSYGASVCDDGSVVVGHAEMLDGSDRAFIWTPTTGILLLSDYLATHGVTVPSGWVFANATSVSADGLTIGGQGSFADNNGQGFVVTIPSPSGFACLLSAALIGCHRRRPS